jgi:hypothetical protein
MALVRGRYYQHSIYINRRVTTRYLGSGELGRLLDEDYALIALERERERAEAREEEEAERKRLALEAARGEGLRRVVATCLEGFGYHRRLRHHWQRRRPVSQPQAPAPAPLQPDQATVDAEIRAAVAAIRKGPDAAAVARLRELAGRYPKSTHRILDMDFSRLARSLIDEKLTVKKQDKGGLLARMEVMAVELSGENPSIAVLLAAELATYNWMETWLLNVICSNDFDGAGLRTSRRRTEAQRRFQKSLSWLEQLKALEERRGPVVNVIT